jgi:hypothetical protein
VSLRDRKAYFHIVGTLSHIRRLAYDRRLEHTRTPREKGASPCVDGPDLHVLSAETLSLR